MSDKDKILPYFLSFPVYAGIKYGEVYASSLNFEGIAVWIPSDKPLTFWRILRSVPLSKIIGFGRSGASKMQRFSEHIDTVHKRLAPFKHWYLQAIGVDPKFQGKGYASKLIRPMLSRIDDEHLRVYLETIDEKNVSIYERFGFRTIGKSVFPGDSFTSWAMLREARDFLR